MKVSDNPNKSIPVPRLQFASFSTREALEKAQVDKAKSIPAPPRPPSR